MELKKKVDGSKGSYMERIINKIHYFDYYIVSINKTHL